MPNIFTIPGYRGDTLTIRVPYATNIASECRAQIRLTEDTLTYRDADSITYDTATSELVVQFSAPKTYALEDIYVADVQWQSGDIVTTLAKYIILFEKDVTRVFGIAFGQIVPTFELLPIADAATNTLYQLNDTVPPTWWWKASPTATEYTEFSITTQSAGEIGFTIDGAGTTIATGEKHFLRIPFDCTITGWTIFANAVGSIVVDIWRDTYANFPPTVADTITGTDKPRLESERKRASSALTGWSTALTADDVLFFNVDSVSNLSKVDLFLSIEK